MSGIANGSPGNELAYQEALLLRAKQGDLRAFEALVLPHEGALYKTCRLQIKTRESAEDALQETMLKAWRSISSFEGRSSVSTWLYRICINCCTDLNRRERLRETDSLDHLRDAGFDPASPERSPEEAAIRKESRKELKDALHALPSDQRVPLMLSAVEGKSYGEISEILSLPEGTVKSRVSRGRALLRQLMREPEKLHDAWNQSNSSPSNHTEAVPGDQKTRGKGGRTR